MTGCIGSITNLYARRTPAMVCCRPQFKQPGVCSLEPVRSTCILSPAIVTVVTTGTGSPPGPQESRAPRAVHCPSGRRETAVRSATSLCIKTSLLAESIVSIPKRRYNFCISRSPVRHAAICACRSPQSAFGRREFRVKKSTMFRSGVPA